MVRRHDFLKLICKRILFYGGRGQVGEDLDRLFGFIFLAILIRVRKSAILLRVPFVKFYNYIYIYIVSDSANINSQKQSGKKIERIPGRPHGYEKNAKLIYFNFLFAQLNLSNCFHESF